MRSRPLTLRKAEIKRWGTLKIHDPSSKQDEVAPVVSTQARRFRPGPMVQVDLGGMNSRQNHMDIMLKPP